MSSMGAESSIATDGSGSDSGAPPALPSMTFFSFSWCLRKTNSRSCHSTRSFHSARMASSLLCSSAFFVWARWFIVSS